MNIKNLFDEARRDLETLVLHRRYLHEHAEIGFELKNTVEYVKK